MIASLPLPEVPVITNRFPFRGVSANGKLTHLLPPVTAVAKVPIDHDHRERFRFPV